MNPMNALGWTLLHFLWQGTPIALLLAAGLALPELNRFAVFNAERSQ